MTVYTQREIAERLGISRRTIYRWIQSGQLERDLDEPSGETVSKIENPPLP